MSVEVSEMKCFNNIGKLDIEIKIKFGKWLSDIVIINDGCLLFIDWNVNIVNWFKNGKIEEIVCFKGWILLNLFVIFFEDIFVMMCNDVND